MLVDCAIAMPVNDADVSNEILQIGVPNKIAEAVEGMNVRKSGRTTGVTTGTIADAHMTVNIGAFTWTNQIRVTGTDPMVGGGDSGSVVVDVNNNLVGLLFAGPKYAPHNYYIANKMTNVANLLNIGEPGVVPPTPISILPYVLGGGALLMAATMIPKTSKKKAKKKPMIPEGKTPTKGLLIGGGLIAGAIALYFILKKKEEPEPPPEPPSGEVAMDLTYLTVDVK